MPTERQVGQHLLPFIVGMRADHHDTSERVQPLQSLADFDFAGKDALAADGDQSQNQQRTDCGVRRPTPPAYCARIKNPQE